jgi:PAS domain-containing protein
MDRWFEIDCFRIGDPEERKVALLFNDITERKKGEDLRRYHSLLLSSVQDAIIAHDDRLRISYWGKGAQEFQE